MIFWTLKSDVKKGASHRDSSWPHCCFLILLLDIVHLVWTSAILRINGNALKNHKEMSSSEETCKNHKRLDLDLRSAARLPFRSIYIQGNRSSSHPFRSLQHHLFKLFQLVPSDQSCSRNRIERSRLPRRRINLHRGSDLLYRFEGTLLILSNPLGEHIPSFSLSRCVRRAILLRHYVPSRHL